jgi:putative FmdB family regulatory protein
MPIFAYSCDDCGTKFEKLVRRSAEADAVHCPSCGQDHLTTQYSTFAARSGASKNDAGASGSAAMEGCGAGMCGSSMCQGGMCGMNMN